MLLLLVIAVQATQPPSAAPPLIRTNTIPTSPVAPAPPSPVQVGKGRPASARANLASYITADDYPVEAIRRGEQGTTGIVLDVGPDGRVIGCTVVQSSGSAVLDSATCRLVRSRARFTPALDRRGQPTTDQVTARIRWQLPKTRIVPDLAVTSFEIGADGVARNCRFTARYYNGREQTLNAPACDEPAVPERLVQALRNQSAADVSQVRQELTLIREASAPWPALQSGGARLVAQARARLQVEPGGKVSSCTMLDSYSVLGITPQPCLQNQAVGDDGVQQTREMRLVLRVLLEKETERR